ncbi:MAG: alanine dehydrogenase [Bacteroidetes bacterium]|nr:alanine dehydrogenase [Bacteroidota bacterium]MBL6944723.1 alanine dehydrogenase [Bacteroidales bacterium]
MNEESKGILKLTNVERLMTQEEMLESTPQKSRIIIGLPKEQSPNENRISLVPEAVELLVESGHKVLIEKGAGEGANFSNEQFAISGANIVNSAEEAYKSDIILKVAPPHEKEIEMMGKHKVLLSSLFLPNLRKGFFTKLMSQKSIAIAYEYIQDKSGALPVMKSISEIVGNTAVLIASQHLRSIEFGKGKLLGGFPGISPAEVVIIGSGTVAEYAARTALGMGASVKIFDNSVYKLRSIQNNLGQSIPTSTLHSNLLKNALKKADVVISAKFTSNGISPCVITDEMVRNMEPGSIIVDVSIDQGGCFETSKATTHHNPIYKVHGVTHYCVPNIASCVPNTASYSLSNILAPMLMRISDFGGIERMIKQDKGFRKGVYIYNGILTNNYIGDMFRIPSQDLELLMAAFR